MSLLVSDLTGFLTEQLQRCRAADSEFLTNMRNTLVAILKSQPKSTTANMLLQVSTAHQ